MRWLWRGRRSLGIVAQDFRGAAVQRLAAGLEQALIRRVLDKRVLEAISRLRRCALDDEEVGPGETVERGLETAVVDRGHCAQKREGKIAPEHGADLRDLACFPEAVEPRRERLLKRRRDRLRAALDSALEQEPRHLLDKQRHAAGSFAHALDHLSAQRMAPGELADHLRDVGGIEGTERKDALV